MTIEEFRSKIREDLKPLAIDYIDTIIFLRGYEKSNVHQKIIELACSYATGIPYDPDEDVDLDIFLHKKSRKITDFLDEKIGLTQDKGFRDRPKHEIKALGDNLADEICELVITLFPDANAVSAFQDSIPKPVPLKTPTRGLIS